MSIDIEFNHPDLLQELNNKAKASEKIQCIHRVIRQSRDFVHRIGIALYDVQSGMVRSFAHSSDNGNDPLSFYEVKLADSKSLHLIYLKGKPRVINDLAVFADSQHRHSKQIYASGYRSSYTIPMYYEDHLTGFVFFNSRECDVFNEENLPHLDMVARLISLLISVELNQVQTLRGALKTATSFTGHRDPETGAHLERMSRFSRLIANELAAENGMNDEWVEAVFWFSPMHDIGKIAIPDHILLKPGKFTAEEFEVMKGHASKGRGIINSMLVNFNLANTRLVPMLGNIAEFHHENMDGSGYPCGLQGEAIPLEARIVAVADVFDALTSQRPYKKAWTNDEAFAELKRLSGWKLDPRCVESLLANRDKVECIQAMFKDEHE